jgi:hypothetical protein
MSKLVDLLDKAGEQQPAPMGFGPASERAQPAPQLILLARVLSDEIIKDPSLGEVDVDSFLVALHSEDAATIDAIAATFGERPWGVRLSEFSAAQASLLQGKGCDFIVFESMATQASVLDEEDLSAIMTMTADTDEETARALNQLPLDAVLYGPSLRQLPLSVETAVEIQKVLGRLEKPLIVEAPEGIGERDLELLRNMGVAGLILDLDTKDDIDRMAKMRRAIEELPRRDPKTAHRDAVLPQLAAEPEASAAAPGEDDDGEDEDEEF